MNRFLSLLLVFCVMAPFIVAEDVPTLPTKEGENFVPGELIAYVPASREAAASEALSILETWGYTATRQEVNFETLSLKLYQAKERSVAKSVEEAVTLFNGSMSREANGIKLVPNYIFRATDADPLFNRKDIVKDKDGNPREILLEWDMKNTGEAGGTVGADLNAVEAWKLVASSENHEVTVAVLDTGVDVDHPAMKNRICKKNGQVVGKDFTNWRGGYMDDHGHGSHCAGSIAAAYNDGEGMTGSSGPANVKIIPIKALAKDGAGDLFTISDAMEWAGKQKANVLSMSLGATPIAPEQEPVLKEIFDGILKSPVLKDTIPVAAAGNDGKDIHAFPAFCDKTISIAASNNQDQLAPFSNFGNWVNVASPGVNIVSLRPKFEGKYLDMYQDAGFKKAEFAIGNRPDEPYAQRAYFVASGTSMATPNAAGVVAMMLAVNPGLKSNTDAVRKILQETSDKQGTFKIQSGRINAFKAVQAALNQK